MFGYVRPPLAALPQPEQDRFRQAYCGLCHTLGRRYGLAARFVLNYDFTFLAILLSDPEPGEPEASRCLASPLKKQPFLPGTPAMDLAADESVILAYWQLRDGVADHDWFHALKYRGLSGLLEGAYRKAAAARPEFDRRTKEQLSALSVLEAERCGSMDRAADTFAVLLQSAALEIEDATRRRVLEQMLYHLGRWIYLVDAADDLKEDAQAGQYNPVALRYELQDGVWTAESREAFAKTLDDSVHKIATAFELLEFGCWRKLLETTIYFGFFQVGRAVLDGTFHSDASQKRNSGKNVEETT